MAKRPTARARASRASSGKPAPSTASSTALANLASDYQTSAFALQPSKRDKRHIRHGQLLARVREGGISKNTSGNGNGNGKTKTRRPSKKLKTDLGDIANALDDVEMEESGEEEEGGTGTGNRKGGGEKSGVYAEDEWEGVSQTSEQEGTEQVAKARRRRRKVVAVAAGTEGKMVMKSLKHRPGSMKRKKVLEEREMERFQRNLAQLAKAEGGSGEGGGEGQEEHIQQRWKALRAFIGGTLVKDKAFEGA